MKTRKLLAVLLTFAMTLSLLPTMAFAEFASDLQPDPSITISVGIDGKVTSTAENVVLYKIATSDVATKVTNGLAKGATNYTKKSELATQLGTGSASGALTVTSTDANQTIVAVTYGAIPEQGSEGDQVQTAYNTLDLSETYLDVLGITGASIAKKDGATRKITAKVASGSGTYYCTHIAKDDMNELTAQTLDEIASARRDKSLIDIAGNTYVNIPVGDTGVDVSNVDAGDGILFVSYDKKGFLTGIQLIEVAASDVDYTADLDSIALAGNTDTTITNPASAPGAAYTSDTPTSGTSIAYTNSNGITTLDQNFTVTLSTKDTDGGAKIYYSNVAAASAPASAAAEGWNEVTGGSIENVRFDESKNLYIKVVSSGEGATGYYIVSATLSAGAEALTQVQGKESTLSSEALAVSGAGNNEPGNPKEIASTSAPYALLIAGATADGAVLEITVPTVAAEASDSNVKTKTVRYAIDGTKPTASADYAATITPTDGATTVEIPVGELAADTTVHHAYIAVDTHTNAAETTSYYDVAFQVVKSTGTLELRSIKLGSELFLFSDLNFTETTASADAAHPVVVATTIELNKDEENTDSNDKMHLVLNDSTGALDVKAVAPATDSVPAIADYAAIPAAGLDLKASATATEESGTIYLQVTKDGVAYYYKLTTNWNKGDNFNLTSFQASSNDAKLTGFTPYTRADNADVKGTDTAVPTAFAGTLLTTYTGAGDATVTITAARPEIKAANVKFAMGTGSETVAEAAELSYVGNTVADGADATITITPVTFTAAGENAKPVLYIKVTAEDNQTYGIYKVSASSGTATLQLPDDTTETELMFAADTTLDADMIAASKLNVVLTGYTFNTELTADELKAAVQITGLDTVGLDYDVAIKDSDSTPDATTAVITLKAASGGKTAALTTPAATTPLTLTITPDALIGNSSGQNVTGASKISVSLVDAALKNETISLIAGKAIPADTKLTLTLRGGSINFAHDSNGATTAALEALGVSVDDAFSADEALTSNAQLTITNDDQTNAIEIPLTGNVKADATNAAVTVTVPSAALDATGMKLIAPAAGLTATGTTLSAGNVSVMPSELVLVKGVANAVDIVVTATSGVKFKNGAAYGNFTFSENNGSGTLGTFASTSLELDPEKTAVTLKQTITPTAVGAITADVEHSTNTLAIDTNALDSAVTIAAPTFKVVDITVGALDKIIVVGNAAEFTLTLTPAGGLTFNETENLTAADFTVKAGAAADLFTVTNAVKEEDGTVTLTVRYDTTKDATLGAQAITVVVPKTQFTATVLSDSTIESITAAAATTAQITFDKLTVTGDMTALVQGTTAADAEAATIGFSTLTFAAAEAADVAEPATNLPVSGVTLDTYNLEVAKATVQSGKKTVKLFLQTTGDNKVALPSGTAVSADVTLTSLAKSLLTEADAAKLANTGTTLAPFTGSTSFKLNINPEGGMDVSVVGAAQATVSKTGEDDLTVYKIAADQEFNLKIEDAIADASGVTLNTTGGAYDIIVTSKVWNGESSTWAAPSSPAAGNQSTFTLEDKDFTTGEYTSQNSDNIMNNFYTVLTGEDAYSALRQVTVGVYTKDTTTDPVIAPKTIYVQIVPGVAKTASAKVTAPSATDGTANTAYTSQTDLTEHLTTGGAITAGDIKVTLKDAKGNVVISDQIQVTATPGYYTGSGQATDLAKWTLNGKLANADDAAVSVAQGADGVFTFSGLQIRNLTSTAIDDATLVLTVELKDGAAETDLSTIAESAISTVVFTVPKDNSAATVNLVTDSNGTAVTNINAGDPLKVMIKADTFKDYANNAVDPAGKTWKLVIYSDKEVDMIESLEADKAAYGLENGQYPIAIEEVTGADMAKAIVGATDAAPIEIKDSNDKGPLTVVSKFTGTTDDSITVYNGSTTGTGHDPRTLAFKLFEVVTDGETGAETLIPVRTVITDTAQPAMTAGSTAELKWSKATNSTKDDITLKMQDTRTAVAFDDANTKVAKFRALDEYGNVSAGTETVTAVAVVAKSDGSYEAATKWEVDTTAGNTATISNGIAAFTADLKVHNKAQTAQTGYVAFQIGGVTKEMTNELTLGVSNAGSTIRLVQPYDAEDKTFAAGATITLPVADIKDANGAALSIPDAGWAAKLGYDNNDSTKTVDATIKIKDGKNVLEIASTALDAAADLKTAGSYTLKWSEISGYTFNTKAYRTMGNNDGDVWEDNDGSGVQITIKAGTPILTVNPATVSSNVVSAEAMSPFTVSLKDSADNDITTGYWVKAEPVNADGTALADNSPLSMTGGDAKAKNGGDLTFNLTITNTAADEQSAAIKFAVYTDADCTALAGIEPNYKLVAVTVEGSRSVAAAVLSTTADSSVSATITNPKDATGKSIKGAQEVKIVLTPTTLDPATPVEFTFHPTFTANASNDYVATVTLDETTGGDEFSNLASDVYDVSVKMDNVAVINRTGDLTYTVTPKALTATVTGGTVTLNKYGARTNSDEKYELEITALALAGATQLGDSEIVKYALTITNGAGVFAEKSYGALTTSKKVELALAEGAADVLKTLKDGDTITLGWSIDLITPAPTQVTAATGSNELFTVSREAATVLPSASDMTSGIKAAPLVDQETGDVVTPGTEYEITGAAAGTASDDPIPVTRLTANFTAHNIPYHQNAANPPENGYWVGFGLPVPAEGVTAEYFYDYGTAPADVSGITFDDEPIVWAQSGSMASDYHTFYLGSGKDAAYWAENPAAYLAVKYTNEAGESAIYVFQFTMDVTVAGYTVTIVDHTEGAATTGDLTGGVKSFTVTAAKACVVVVEGEDTEGDATYALLPYTGTPETDDVDGKTTATYEITGDVKVHIAFKGDFNLDGAVNSTDAGDILEGLVTSFNDVEGIDLKKLTGNTDTDELINSSDAGNILENLVSTTPIINW